MDNRLMKTALLEYYEEQSGGDYPFCKNCERHMLNFAYKVAKKIREIDAVEFQNDHNR